MRYRQVSTWLLSLAVIASALTVAVAGTSDGTVVGLTKIWDKGPAASRFNLVLVAEGYTESEQAQFEADAQAFVDFLFTTPPFATTCSAINVWRLDVISDESGADDPAACGGSGATVNTYFDASFCGDGTIRRLLVSNGATAVSALTAALPEWDQALVIVNSTTYGGSGGVVGTTSLAGTWENIAIHEFGHSAFGLADEYEYWAGCGVDTMNDNHPASEPVEANVTTETDPEMIKWASMIDATTSVPTTANADCSMCDTQADPYPGSQVVGLYEGAHYYHCDAYRPVFDCMMRNFAPYCPVCTQRILDVLGPYEPPNTPPTCDPGGPYVAECAGATTQVMLVGDAEDFDCDPLTFDWTGGFEGGMASGPTPVVTFAGLGEFDLTLDVADEDEASTCMTTATVQDTIAPQIMAPTDAILECEGPTGTTGDIGMPTVTDMCDDAPTVANDAPALFPLGTTVVTWTATDMSGNASMDGQNVTVQDTIPPMLTPPADVMAECTGPMGTPVDIGMATVEDICDDMPTVGNDAPPLFPLGTTVVTWSATDMSGNASMGGQNVTIADTTPPMLSVSASPDHLWPPNHKFVRVDVNVTMSDVCDAMPALRLVSITSNEPDNGRGDGNTAPDVEGAEFGTDDRTFFLRAERQGGRDGRVYTIVYEAEDMSGNVTPAEIQVTVVHDQRQ